MWCYQKPGYEALLLAELQRQQQCSQFCDTLLRTEGVSVPAHSCILSAISPHISSALSSTPPPPAGQSHLLDFKALGACTLLHMVRLLYSGEMAGEGEAEKQDAISAAAKLGIHGLVEVTRRDRGSRREDGDGWRAEMGVQTEPEETDGRRGRWRREVRDGSTFLWEETPSEGEKDTCTLTEEVLVNTAPPPPCPPPCPPHPAGNFETIDMAALQSLGQTDSHLLPPQIPYVPISLVYPTNESTHHPSSGPVDSTAAGHTSVDVLAPPYTSEPPPLHPYSTLCAADPQSWWSTPQRAAEESENEQLEQFQGNIPGYINYFLNPDKEEGPRRGRPRGRRAAAGGGARRAGTGERRARRPRAGTGRRGRGGLTQTVDVQDVGVSRLQMLFLQRWSMRTSRSGQGGGAAGRKLYLKTRELLKPPRQRRRGRGKGWVFSPSRDMPHSEGGAGNTQRGRRSAVQQFNQDDVPVGRARRARAKPTVSVAFSSPPLRFYNLHSVSASSPSLQPSPSHGLLSPAASYVCPASSLLHSTPVPHLAPPPPVEQPEHIDRLLEEVMMGLDILPNTNNGAPCSQLRPTPIRSSSCASSGITLTPNKQVETTGVGASSSEEPILQQQGDGALTEMLEHFLQSFERHIDRCTVREEVEMGVQSCTETPVRSSQITEQCQSNTYSQRRKAPVYGAVAPKCTQGTPGKDTGSTKRRRKRRKNEYQLSLERKRVRVKNPAPSSDAKTKIIPDRGDKQLQQMPVVKLERRGLLPARVTLQGHSCQSPDVKSLAKTESTSSPWKHPHGRLSGNNQQHAWGTKIYPIRSRLREAQMDSLTFLEGSLTSPPGSRRGRPKQNGHLLSLSSDETSAPPIQPQPVDEQLEKSQEHIQPQEEAEGPTERGEKRGAESEEETSGDGTVNKRVCFERTPQPTSETCTPGSESAAIETEDVIDVETVSLTSVGDCLQGEEGEEKPLRSVLAYLRETEVCLTDEEIESCSDEIIDVDGDEEDDRHKEQSRAATAPSHFADVKPSVSRPSLSEVSLGSTGSWDVDKDEDVDVLGGSSPVPDPVIISWTESSEDEKQEGSEDIEVVEEETTQVSSVVFAV